jgi:hypothetical protein
VNVKESAHLAASMSFVAVCAAGAVASLGDCQLQGSCAPSREWYDGQLAATTLSDVHAAVPDGAGVVDETTWESGPIDSTWLDYPGQRADFLFPNGVGSPPEKGPFPGPYTNVIVYVSPNPDANGLGSNWTFASGNLGEVTVHPPDTTPGGETDWFVAVVNDTCAGYYLRVVVSRAAPDGGPPQPLDAGDAGSDGGILDGGE